jgi:16S rRNA (cytosine967-C5)-methyltransferase
MNCRAHAASVVSRLQYQQQSLTPLIISTEGKVAEKDRGLFQALCFGVARHYFSLNALSKILLDKPLPIDGPYAGEAKDAHSLLLVGLFQLAYGQISEHAAINETVSAAEQMGLSNYKGLVNAILRRFQREKDALLAQLQQSDVTRFEHPKWLVKMLEKAWPGQAADIMTAANQQAPMTLRVNQMHHSRHAYLEMCHAVGIDAIPTLHSPVGIQLQQATGVAHLPGFAEGLCSVQDEAAQLAAHLLGAAEDELILDACAAPGGKTCHLLEISGDRAHVIALDADGKRLLRVNENLHRLKLHAKVLEAQAQDTASWWDGQTFDRILLDVPCSATGVIRRHPDIKLLRERDDIERLANLQQAILQAIWPTLKVGGQLLYATCSVLPQENADNIKLFLDNTPDAHLLPIHLACGTDTGYGHQLFPQINGHDGFFYARLQKTDKP